MQQTGSPGDTPRRTRFVHESGNLAVNLMLAAGFSIWLLKALSLQAESRLVAFLAAAAALTMLFAALVCLIYSRARIFLSRRAAMEDRATFAAALLPALKRRADVEFSLFLRPFFVDDVFKWKSTGRFAQDSRSFWQFGGKLDLEESLATAIDRICPLVAMGGASIGYGPPEIQAMDARWQDEIMLLIERARLIIAVPFAQPATRWEIENIVRGGYLPKTVFLIPPFRRRTKVSRTFAGRTARAIDVYHESLGEFTKFGLELPRVSLGGAILWQEEFSGRWIVNQLGGGHDFEPLRLRQLLLGKLRALPGTASRDLLVGRGPGLRR